MSLRDEIISYLMEEIIPVDKKDYTSYVLALSESFGCSATYVRDAIRSVKHAAERNDQDVNDYLESRGGQRRMLDFLRVWMLVKIAKGENLEVWGNRAALLKVFDELENEAQEKGVSAFDILKGMQERLKVSDATEIEKANLVLAVQMQRIREADTKTRLNHVCDAVLRFWIIRLEEMERRKQIRRAAKAR